MSITRGTGPNRSGWLGNDFNETDIFSDSCSSLAFRGPELSHSMGYGIGFARHREVRGSLTMIPEMAWKFEPAPGRIKMSGKLIRWWVSWLFRDALGEFGEHGTLIISSYFFANRYEWRGSQGTEVGKVFWDVFWRRRRTVTWILVERHRGLLSKVKNEKTRLVSVSNLAADINLVDISSQLVDCKNTQCCTAYMRCYCNAGC